MTIAYQRWGEGPCIAALVAMPGDQEITVAAAVREGLYNAGQAQRDGYHSIRRSSTTFDAMLGAVVDRFGVLETPTTLIYTGVHDHGMPGLWQPAAFIQKRLGADSALAWSLSHGCNGMAIALMNAHQMATTAGGPTFIFTADRFENDGFDRWQSDSGLVYGDAACAVSIDKTGFARIVWQDIVYLSALGAMHGTEPADGAERWNVTKTKKAFVAAHGGAAFFQPLLAALQQMVDRLLEAKPDNGSTFKALATPFVGETVSAGTYAKIFDPLAVDLSARHYGRTVGHTGASDQLLGLNHLLEQGRLSVGDTVLLVGAGAGFSVSLTAVQIARVPKKTKEGAWI